jgi:acetyl esterase/lipase
MRRLGLALLPVLLAARTPLERLEPAHLAATHEQRVQWMKERVVAKSVGVYHDYRAILYSHDAKGARAEVLKAAHGADVDVIMWPEGGGPKPENRGGMQDGVLFIAERGDEHLLEYPPADSAHLAAKYKQYPDEAFAAANDETEDFLERFETETAEHRFAGIAMPSVDPQAVALRFVSTHILARNLTEQDIRESLAAGHVYIAHDWLCDPSGFTYTAQNNLGVFDIGDPVLLTNNTHVLARLPIAAKTRVLRNGEEVAAAWGRWLDYRVTEPGAYRLEASLLIDGEERPWIFTNPLYVSKAPAYDIPSSTLAESVEWKRNISYTEGDPADAQKHMLDLYLPKDKRNFPVLVFLHGGAWRSGDRSLYPPLGNKFAKLGIGVAIPSYRLMPKDAHPAQIEDAAAAFAWVYQNIGSLGGDVNRIYVAGHSAGGHLAALLALDDSYLKKHEIPAGAIKGVAALSGVYDLTGVADFNTIAAKLGRDPSPLHFVPKGASHEKLPSFLISYCQWDYEGLPQQARDFDAALKKAFIPTRLLYVPGESHISEVISMLKDEDATARAVLEMIQ